MWYFICRLGLHSIMFHFVFVNKKNVIFQIFQINEINLEIDFTKSDKCYGYFAQNALNVGYELLWSFCTLCQMNSLLREVNFLR